jgi:hypothetical protein
VVDCALLSGGSFVVGTCFNLLILSLFSLHIIYFRSDSLSLPFNMCSAVVPQRYHYHHKSLIQEGSTVEEQTQTILDTIDASSRKRRNKSTTTNILAPKDGKGFFAAMNAVWVKCVDTDNKQSAPVSSQS